MNLSETIDYAASNWPESPALVFEDSSMSYADLIRSINRLSNAFVKAGIGIGDRVMTLMGNRPEFVICYYAAMRIGAITVTINPLSTSYELSHYMAESKPCAIVCGPEQLPKFNNIKDALSYIKLIVTTVPVEGAVSFGEIMCDFSDTFSAVDMDKNDPAVIIFTAGLLGKSLGATLTHHNLDTNSDLLRDIAKVGPETRGLALIPLFHAFGASTNLLGTQKVGGSVYLVEKVDFPKLIPWLKQAQITWCGLVPMVYYGLLYHPSCRDLDLTSIKIAISGGAHLPYEIYEKFTARYGIDVHHGYGLTEASPVVSWNSIKIPNKPRTVGQPVPHVTIQIHDERGKPLPVGTEGEVVVQGPNVMLGYYGKPQETATVIRNNWLYTGDIGRLDEEGYLTLTGLKKDLIITSGFNVYCQEVEEILIRHPHVADVALVGVDDLMRGQVIEAIVIPEPGSKPDDRDIMRFCKEYLSRYKCPRKVIFVKEIDRDANGKASGWR